MDSGKSARLAEVLLGSQLLEEAELDDLIEGLSGKRDKRRRLVTGVKDVDDALGGGLGPGVVGIWSEVGGGSNEVSRALLVSFLLGNPESTAALIDTTGNFDILRLYTLLVTQLQKKPNVFETVRSATSFKAEATAQDVAAKVLDHVKIMRVFDFVGLREAMNELRDGLEGRTSVNVRKHAEPDESSERGEVSVEVSATKEVPKPGRTVVADSEDEDEEEMLFDISTKRTNTENVQTGSPEAISESKIELSDIGPQESTKPSKVSLILIDNVNHILGPLLKKDHIKGNALASTLFQAMNHLTRTHNLYTILTNPATHPRPQSPTRKAQDAPYQSDRPPQPEKRPPPSPSIFTSVDLIPSLLHILPRFVEVGLLISQLPRRKIDARVFYKDAENNSQGTGLVKKPRGVEMVNVLEVMSDRREARVGAWGAFMDDEGGIKDVP